MKFTELAIPGAFLVEIEPLRDDRGFFARVFSQDEFETHGLPGHYPQTNLCLTEKRGTVRGMHFQLPPDQEVKLIRCCRGRIFDVIVDLRLQSDTHLQWIGVELDGEEHRMLVVPEGCAHGYQTLTDDCLLFYQVSAVYSPASERGARWNDPVFGIEWPIAESILSPKDRVHPDYDSPGDFR